jgi:orotidine-5'-phosphate decarboxylase
MPDIKWSTLRLSELIQHKQSHLCVGLDNRIEDLPPDYPKSIHGLEQFNKLLIDLTRPYAVAYKPNTAFYEELGPAGWELLQELFRYIGSDFFRIADAKRGDIGNTAKAYARAFFETMQADAVTVNPYMGKDSVLPFLEYDGKFCIALGITSNPGADDLQKQILHSGESVFEFMCRKLANWGTEEQLMLVVGATQSAQLQKLRQIVPEHFFLVPGIGAQGGNLENVLKYGKSSHQGLLINASRGISSAWKNSKLSVSESITFSAKTFSAY